MVVLSSLSRATTFDSQQRRVRRDKKNEAKMRGKNRAVFYVEGGASIYRRGAASRREARRQKGGAAVKTPPASAPSVLPSKR